MAMVASIVVDLGRFGMVSWCRNQTKPIQMGWVGHHPWIIIALGKGKPHDGYTLGVQDTESDNLIGMH